MPLALVRSITFALAQVNPSVLLLMKTLAIVLFLWHWTACAYWFVAVLEHDTLVVDFCDIELASQALNCNRWFDLSALRAGLGARYAHSFFWAIVVTTGVGWDILPSTVCAASPFAMFYLPHIAGQHRARALPVSDCRRSLARGLCLCRAFTRRGVSPVTFRLPAAGSSIYDGDDRVGRDDVRYHRRLGHIGYRQPQFCTTREASQDGSGATARRRSSMGRVL